MDKGFRTKEKRWECRASIQKKSTLTWLHVDKVKLCNMQHSSDALLQAFSKIGTVVKIAPKIWEGIPIPSRSWLVVMSDIKGNVPHSLLVDGAPVTVETSGGERVCRECFTVEHKESCSRGWKVVQGSNKPKSQDKTDAEKNEVQKNPSPNPNCRLQATKGQLLLKTPLQKGLMHGSNETDKRKAKRL